MLLAERWYGEYAFWEHHRDRQQPPDGDPAAGHGLIQPRLNRNHTVVAVTHAPLGSWPRTLRAGGDAIARSRW